MHRAALQTLAAAFCLSFGTAAAAVTTVFFDASQVATAVASGVTSDTISSNGYLFTYTRDKLFTGGTGSPIGRPVRVPWPQGVEAQAVTTPPPGVTDYKARITLQRVDGELFDLTAFTAKLLANTFGTGAAIEIMPSLGGEDGFNDPLYFDASGSYGQTFSYNASPNYLGSTALLTGFDRYNITLFVDFAFTNLQLSWTPANLVWSGAGSGVWDVNNTPNFLGKPSGKFSDGDYVTFDDAGSATAITIAAGGVAPGDVTFANTTKDYLISGGPIGGVTGLAVSGGGHVTLNGANAYTGTTTVDAGTLTLTGTATTSNVVIGVDGTLELSTPGAVSALLANTPITSDGNLVVGTAHQEVGAIDGIGAVSVAAGASLTADSILQNTLTIGAGGSVTIRETLGAGGGVSAVPEPATWMLIAAASLCWLLFRRR